MQSGVYVHLPQERVIFGLPAPEAAAAECERLGAKRAFIVASRTLATKTPLIGSIRERLGARFAGLFDRCEAHTPWLSVLAGPFNAIRSRSCGGNARLRRELHCAGTERDILKVALIFVGASR
jgi:alcohol dehydrogenase class IV